MGPSSLARRRPRLVGLATLLALTLGAVTAAPASALDPRDITPPPPNSTVYSVPYSGDLYEQRWTSDGAWRVTMPLTLEGWAHLRYATPTPAPTELVHTAWSPDIWAVTYFAASPSSPYDSSWVWKKLTPAEWQRAGSPAPRVAGHIAGTQYANDPASPNILAVLGSTAHVMSFAEWAAAGFPAPHGYAHHWKLTWSPGIAWYGGPDSYNPDQGYDVTDPYDGILPLQLTLDEWVAAGGPTPVESTMLPSDTVCRIEGGSDLWYAGLTFEAQLTFAQWQAAGSPTPTGTC